VRPGLPSDPEGEDPFAFRRVEDGTLVLVGLAEFYALNGLRVVSFESRRSAEMAELIRNYRGEHDPGAVHARGPAVNMLELEILKVNNGAPAYSTR